MAKQDNVPAPAVRRLSLYLRQLEMFLAAERETVSSKELGEPLGLSDAQVRKDLAYFGQFGYPGIGYRVPELVNQVRAILGTDKESNILLVGLGNLGRALLSFQGFNRRGFRVCAVFDKDPNIIGQPVEVHKRLRVQSPDRMPTAVKNYNIRLGILAVPATEAPIVADQMVEAGIRGILNFAPVALKLAHGTTVGSVDLAVDLEQLAFRLNDRAL